MNRPPTNSPAISAAPFKPLPPGFLPPRSADRRISLVRLAGLPPAPLAWFGPRELFLHLLFTPVLLLPLLAGGSALLAWRLQWRPAVVLAFALLIPLAVSTVCSPAATAAAFLRLNRQSGSVVYVSGDQRSPAERLLALGVPPPAASPATPAHVPPGRTPAAQPPGSANTILEPPCSSSPTPWQLARATAAFRHYTLQVIPLAVITALTPAQRDRLALRETAATLLYRLQGPFKHQ